MSALWFLDQVVDALREIGYTTAGFYRCLPFLREYLPPAGISFNRERLCHFLAQTAYESGGFNFLEEIADGSAYEDRTDLGNIQVGDGRKFKGRGIIQLTGRANYQYYGRVIGVDLVQSPQLASDPKIAVKIACCYWTRNNLNNLADAGDFRAITRSINGGLNGLDDRWRCLNRFMTVYDRLNK